MSTPPNIVLVTVDCMRRDRLSAYGHHRQTTPVLDSLLERAIHCTSAHSVSSWTCPAVVSLLDMIEKPAPKLVDRALAWIREERAAGDHPFLLWLHLGDAHEPLDIPRSMQDVFGRVPRTRRTLRWDYTKRADAVGTPEFERYREARDTLYDVSLRSADASIGDLRRGLQSLGEADRTIMVVTADHGEEFWEHRQEEVDGFLDPRDVFGTGHGHNLFQVHLLIPLILTGPGIDPAQVDANVSLVDVVPTLLDAAGLERPPEGPAFDGRSLLEPVEARPILAEGIAYGHEKKSVILSDLKLLSAPLDGYERVFRLGPDRREVEVVEDPSEAERLRAYLPGEESAMGEQVEASDEIVEHLKALGYIE